ncbi:MAG TPA: 30S ribosomal protein S19e [Thermoplasmata archaeon]|nr:30S ribosomal protein S19e [Thermoplasmata archaeon]
MTTVYDVPAQPLIESVAVRLKELPECAPPEWTGYVKTGVHKERPPVQDDWWYVRLGAVLRKVYVHGPIGIERTAALFGGKEDRGVKPYKARKGSRAIIRRAFQQLEAAGLVEKVGTKGRRVTPKGWSLLDNVAHEVAKSLALPAERSEEG